MIEESISVGKRAVESFDNSNPEHNRRQAIAYNNLSIAYAHAGDYQEAYNCVKRSLKLKKADNPNGDSSSIALGHVNLSDNLLYLGRFEESLEEAVRADTIFSALGYRDSLSGSTALQNVGSANVGLGRFEEAKPQLLEALRLKKKHMAPKDPDWAMIYLDLARLYAGLNEESTAEKYFSDAITNARQTLGERHPRLAYIHLEYAKFLEKTDRKKEASDLRVQATEVTEYWEDLRKRRTH
jgi:tetratricopeptide (TPR) repeat protein